MSASLGAEAAGSSEAGSRTVTRSREDMSGMRYRHLSAAGCALVAFVAVLGVTAFSQTNLPAESIGGPLSSAPVLGVPFSADATTTVHVILRDGTRLDQSMTDRYYRDSAGRVRIERHLEGLPAPKTAFERHFRTIVAPDPSRWPGVYTVDAETGTARLLPRSIVANSAGGNRWFDVPVGGTRFLTFHRARDLLSADPGAFGDMRDEPLGSKRVSGVEATGRRMTIVVPPGYLHNNDTWIKMVDERWESAELQLLVQAWHSDSMGTIEYRLSNIRRAEQPAHLFELPPDYEKPFPISPNESAGSYTAAENPRAGAFIAGKMRR